MPQKQEKRQGSIYRKRKEQLLRRSVEKDEKSKYSHYTSCGKGKIIDPATGRCIQKPNIKKIPGVGKRNIAAREPLSYYAGGSPRKERTEQVKRFNISQRKKAKAKAKKRYQ